MKPKSILLLISIFLLIQSKSMLCQTISFLDEKRGWKNLKLGESLYNYSSSITEEIKNVKYTYKNKNCEYFFNTKTEKISLIVDRDSGNILFIEIFLEKVAGPYDDIYDTDFNQIRIKLTDLFGEHSASKVNQDTGEVYFHNKPLSKLLLKIFYFS